jgi:hypothetical protein
VDAPLEQPDRAKVATTTLRMRDGSRANFIGGSCSRSQPTYGDRLPRGTQCGLPFCANRFSCGADFARDSAYLVGEALDAEEAST